MGGVEQRIAFEKFNETGSACILGVRGLIAMPFTF